MNGEMPASAVGYAIRKKIPGCLGEGQPGLRVLYGDTHLEEGGDVSP